MQNSSRHDMQVDSLGAFAARSPLDLLAVSPHMSYTMSVVDETDIQARALRPLQPVHLARRARAVRASRP